jgi:hypothetical protein
MREKITHLDVALVKVYSNTFPVLNKDGIQYVMAKAVIKATIGKILKYKEDPYIERILIKLPDSIEYYIVSGKEIVWEVWPQCTPPYLQQVVFVKLDDLIDSIDIIFYDINQAIKDVIKGQLNQAAVLAEKN